MNELDSLVRTIGATDVERYLTAHGWRRLAEEADEEGYALFEAPRRDDFGDPIEIAVPTVENADLLAEAVPRVLQITSLVEGRSRYDVAAEMSPTNIDLFSVRIVSAVTRSAIRLRSAAGMYRALHGLFLAGASLQANPAPWHRHPHHIASEFAAGLFLLPATERSFSFAVQSNLADLALLTHFRNNREKAAAFKRDVMARVVRGLYRCRLAAADGNRWENINDEFKNGMNANMCEAVVRMYQEVAASDTVIEFSVAWSPKRDIPEDLRPVGAIQYTENVVQAAFGLATFLKKEPGPVRIDVVGRVVALKDKTEEEPQMNFLFGDDKAAEEGDPYDKDRVVTVRVEHPIESAGRNVSVLHMSLDDNDYATACTAHNPRTKARVRVKGHLVWRGGRWILDPCDYFARLD